MDFRASIAVLPPNRSNITQLDPLGRPPRLGSPKRRKPGVKRLLARRALHRHRDRVGVRRRGPLPLPQPPLPRRLWLAALPVGPEPLRDGARRVGRGAGADLCVPRPLVQHEADEPRAHYRCASRHDADDLLC
ncbi:hypothetical protein FJTKL_02242 [Diaporthe vaccinii]|uniref:Uncharacterized protein n=1 Tax=Diaporthe vaccinii TaxID=105482 RepID=A0ABR4F3F2_9PEZI